MKLKKNLRNFRIVINKVHSESIGYFLPYSKGRIDFIESDGSVWVNFDKGQAGVRETGYSLYVGNLNDCDELFELVDERLSFL
ncbi:hypothetical protein [Aquitalea denitrificans]|uniref:hypothetical protein n=1 Tax=Aquitalea denitrificans TaxID=519081 RepID=UPI0013593294|nr:hypothetical protein [Aquitalea denitrificans]